MGFGARRRIADLVSVGGDSALGGWDVRGWEGQGSGGEAEEDGLGLHDDRSRRTDEKMAIRLGERERGPKA